MNPAYTWVEVAGLRPVARDTYVLTFLDEPGAAAIRPGQFCMISSAEGVSSGVYLPRPFSYFRTLDGGRVEILFRTLGRGTRWLAGLRPGDRVGVFGPLGRPFQPLEEARQVLLVAGGVGLPPLAMLAGRLASRENPPQIDLLYGETVGERLVDLSGVLPPGVRLWRASEDGVGADFHGRVTELLTSRVWSQLAAPPAVYTCGPRAMMAALAGILESREVLEFQASLEENMACGHGICMGCAVELSTDSAQPYYKLCCKDGPVFDGFEVKWRST